MRAPLALQTRQHPTLTRRLQQSLCLLQLSSLERQQELRAAPDTNPFLEEASLEEDDNFATAAADAGHVAGRHDSASLEYESTVSRATANKYMATPQGTFSFRFFFPRELETQTGGTCSSEVVRVLLREMVAGQDRCEPLTDVTLARLLR